MPRTAVSLQINSKRSERIGPLRACARASDELLSRRKIFLSSRDHQPPNYIIWPRIHANTITVIAHRADDWLWSARSLFTREEAHEMGCGGDPPPPVISDIFQPIFRATCMLAAKLVWLSKNLIGLDALINWVSRRRGIYFCVYTHTHTRLVCESERSLKRFHCQCVRHFWRNSVWLEHESHFITILYINQTRFEVSNRLTHFAWRYPHTGW